MLRLQTNSTESQILWSTVICPTCPLTNGAEHFVYPSTLSCPDALLLVLLNGAACASCPAKCHADEGSNSATCSENFLSVQKKTNKNMKPKRSTRQAHCTTRQQQFRWRYIWVRCLCVRLATQLNSSCRSIWVFFGPQSQSPFLEELFCGLAGLSCNTCCTNATLWKNIVTKPALRCLHRLRHFGLVTAVKPKRGPVARVCSFWIWCPSIFSWQKSLAAGSDALGWSPCARREKKKMLHTTEHCENLSVF